MREGNREETSSSMSTRYPLCKLNISISVSSVFQLKLRLINGKFKRTQFSLELFSPLRGLNYIRLIKITTYKKRCLHQTDPRSLFFRLPPLERIRRKKKHFGGKNEFFKRIKTRRKISFCPSWKIFAAKIQNLTAKFKKKLDKSSSFVSFR